MSDVSATAKIMAFPGLPDGDEVEFSILEDGGVVLTVTSGDSDSSSVAMNVDQFTRLVDFASDVESISCGFLEEYEG